MFFSPKNRWSVGIDIGGTNVKLACLQKGEQGVELMTHGFFKRDNLVRLKEAFQTTEIRLGDIRVNIEDPTIKIRKIEIPQVPEKELPEVIKWGVKDVVVGHVEDYVFRYRPLPNETGAKQQPYLVFAIQREVVNKYLSLLKTIGIDHVQVVEPNAAALLSSFLHNYDLTSEDRFVLVDMGGQYSLFTVLSQEGLLFSRPLGGISGDALTKQISRDLGIEMDQAEQLKITYQEVKDSKGKDMQLKNTIGNFFSKAVLEIQRSIDGYMTQFPKHPATKIFFTGGGANLTGLTQHVANTLQIQVEMFEPFQKVNLNHFGPEAMEEKGPYYGLACGLALDS